MHNLLKQADKKIDLQGRQTGIGFGSKETTTPAISAILCVTKQNKMLEDSIEKENISTRMSL